MMCLTFVKIAKRMRSGEGTVSRHVHEYEAAVNAAGVVMNAKVDKK